VEKDSIRIPEEKKVRDWSYWKTAGFWKFCISALV
jgi:hypothetical protein